MFCNPAKHSSIPLYDFLYCFLFVCFSKGCLKGFFLFVRQGLVAAAALGQVPVSYLPHLCWACAQSRVQGRLSFWLVLTLAGPRAAQSQGCLGSGAGQAAQGSRSLGGDRAWRPLLPALRCGSRFAPSMAPRHTPLKPRVAKP